MERQSESAALNIVKNFGRCDWGSLPSSSLEWLIPAADRSLLSPCEFPMDKREKKIKNL
jgi:hypothetical protein